MIDYREDNRWTVYVHIVPKELSGYDHDKYYVGITSLKPEYRWSNGNGYKEQFFYRAIKKYGWENIQHEIVAKCLTEEEAFNFEMKLIKELKANNAMYGYNVSDGGFGGKGLKGDRNPLYGKPLSEETKRKLSEAVKGKIMTESSKKKISKAIKELWQDEEYRKKRHETYLRNPKPKELHHFYQKHGFENPTSKAVICLNNLKIYGSATDAGKDYSNFSTICSCCRGERYVAGKDAHGLPLMWMWYDDYQKLYSDDIKNHIIISLKETKTRPIINMDTHELFSSPRIVLNHYSFNVGIAQFVNAIKKNNYYKGYKWKYLFEYMQENNFNYQETLQSLFFVA